MRPTKPAPTLLARAVRPELFLVLVAFTLAGWAGLWPSLGLAQTLGPQDILRIAQIEQVTDRKSVV